jgi:hypothetical protein
VLPTQPPHQNFRQKKWPLAKQLKEAFISVFSQTMEIPAIKTKIKLSSLVKVFLYLQQMLPHFWHFYF